MAQTPPLKFLVDRCAGHRLATWLRAQGYDVVDASSDGPDPDDRSLLRRAAEEGRIMVTLDADFGYLVFSEGQLHCGLVRLPDERPADLIAHMTHLLAHYAQELASGAIITVRGGKTRISRQRRG